MSQIVGDALRLYRGLPEEARRMMRAAGRQEPDEAAHIAARALLTAREAVNRERIGSALRGAGRALPSDEGDILDEAARLTD